MKKTVLSAVVIFLLAGCASSERMSRMSGDFIASYSIPKSTRLRSEKYRQHSNFAHGRDDNAKKLDLNAGIVNLWPFFFRSAQYYAFLWPFADFDPYGMAIRPFYNHEGDDYSILFPLSAWNMADKSGWALFACWNPQVFAFLPFIWHSFKESDGTMYYTPFFIHTWKKNKTVTWYDTLRNKQTTVCFPVYCEKRCYVDTTGFEYVRKAIYDRPMPHNGKNTYEFRKNQLENELRYRGIKGPADGETMSDWVTKLFNSLPDRTDKEYGFFPLFHYCCNAKDERSLRLLLMLYAGETKDSREYKFLCPFTGRYREKNGDIFGWKSSWTFDAWLLLSRFEGREIFESTPAKKAWHNLYAKTHDDCDYHKDPTVQSELAVLDPSLKLPQTVVDANTFRLFLNDYYKAHPEKFPAFRCYEGWTFPLFSYTFDKYRKKFFSIALMTNYIQMKNKLSFISVPLLTKYERTAGKTVFTVGTPLLWYSKTTRTPNTFQRPFLPYGTKFAGNYEKIEETDDYGFFGLFYHGKEVFRVEKRSIPQGKAESIRQKLAKVFEFSRKTAESQKRLTRRLNEARARHPKTKIARYEQLIELERIRMDQEKLEARKKQAEELKQEIFDAGKNLHFAVPADFCGSREKYNAVQESLTRQFTEKHTYEDYGHGILFRKELFHNGDFNWHICHFLAGGEKKGDYEKTHFLQLFYRRIQQGKKSETLCFPFILTRNDGVDRYFSFMWRVLEFRKKQGKCSGHILFIPF